MPAAVDLAALSAARDRIRAEHLHAKPERPAPSARGVHHVALVSSDVERTVRFYQDVLEFPLTEVFENRDLPGSTHFFFDCGNGNAIAFFDLPGVDVGVRTPKCSAACITWPSRRKGGGGSGSGRTSTRPAWSTRTSTRCRCTSATRTVRGWS